ncbi:MAG: head-tail adaptor protein [Desulfobacterales bacterium]|nr:head-tail adaptor protein [Desulfobacterales bacterium]
MRKNKSKKIIRQHHVKFIHIPMIDDGFGGETEGDPAMFHECYAELIPQSSKEVIENMKLGASTVMKVNITYRTGILPTMKMEHVKTSKMYEIIDEPINRDMANRSLDIVVKEIKK